MEVLLNLNIVCADPQPKFFHLECVLELTYAISFITSKGHLGVDLIRSFVLFTRIFIKGKIICEV